MTHNNQDTIDLVKGLEDIKAAVEYNTSNGLYANSPEFKRVYFTYSGGNYNGQRGDVKSAYYLDKLISDINNKLYTITDIEIISTSNGYNNLIQKAV